MTGLLPQHQTLIEESAISEEVAKARGYRSVETKAELGELGFGESQRRVPALLIPVRNTAGDIANYLLRPDKPRIKDGRSLKYELPPRSQMVPDVPSAARGDIDDPRVPLFITEGSRKADAAVSVGLCCVSLIGVWCWRGTNEKGGKVALPDFESVALNDRAVYIVFDSDVMTKPSVHGALARLSAFLRSRDAGVHYIYLPPGEKGEKVGLDDFLAHGAGRAELMALASDQLRGIEGQDEAKCPYVETENGIVWRKSDSETVELTNFTAQIIADIVEDDGAEERRLLEIESKFNGRSKTFQIPASQFESLDWVIEKVGAGAAVAPGYTQRQRARHAIQILSGDPPRHTRFAHLGWREIGGRSVYLSGGAAIAADGVLDGTDVAISGALEEFALPTPPTREELRNAVRVSLEIAELAPDPISIPLLAAIYRAPLGPSDFSVFLVGPTGVFKTATAAICQAHWGSGLDERNLPESFRSTVNAIEGLLFQAKDSLVVVDEFAPGGTRSEIEKAHRDADRVLRSQGNRAGRSRMTRDARLRSAKRPRGLTLVTGEDVPAGQSLRARIFALELTSGSIDVDVLTDLQQAGRDGLLAQAMAGFIRHTAARRDEAGADLQVERDRVRKELSAGQGHRRTSAAAADLLVGIERLADFATECEVFNVEQAEDFKTRSRQALEQAATRQHRHQGDAEPTERFRALINSALASGVAHIANPLGEAPKQPLGLGWHSVGETWQPKGKRIGWVDDGQIYLDLTASLAATQEVAKGVAPITVGQDTLRKRLHERGHLASTELAGRETYAVRKKLEGKRREVLHVAPRFLEADAGRSDQDRPDGSGEVGAQTERLTIPDRLSEAAGQSGGRDGQASTEGELKSMGTATTCTQPGGSGNKLQSSDRADHPDHADPDQTGGSVLERELARLKEESPELFPEGR